MTDRCVRTNLLCALVIAAGSLAGIQLSSMPVAAQVAATHAPTGMVSDWTHHHVLYPQSNDAAVAARMMEDPRWVQSWYQRHPEQWWPGWRRRRILHREHRDWSVPLGVAYYGALFDSTFAFTIGTASGSGVLTSADLGNGSLLATAGTLNVTGDANTYSLFPGGPTPTPSPGGIFSYDDVLSPLQPQPIDIRGMLFLGPGPKQINIFYDNTAIPNPQYSFWTYVAPGPINKTDDPAGSFIPSVNPAPDPGGGQIYPAKFAFNINQTPSCTNDFVVVGIPTSRIVAGQANIIGFNNLYTNGAGNGFCSGTGPNVKFAYTSGTGQVPGSVVISQNGQQVAYVENTPGKSFFHVLTIGTTGNNGTGATSPVNPGIGGVNNAVDTRVRLTPDGTIDQSSTSSPFVVFTHADANDVAYVTTYDLSGGTGVLYKISNVFTANNVLNVPPSIVWSVPITAVPSTPVYDKVSNKVFFTDSHGRIDYVLDTGVAPTVTYGPIVAGSSTSENPPIVDSSHGMVYASFNSDGTHAVVVQAPISLASTVTVPVGTANTTFTGPYLPDFNHAWYSGSGTPMMFVAGHDTGTGTDPLLYGVGFSAGVMNNFVSFSAPLTTGPADASPVSEFFNVNLNKDFLFVGVSNNCIATQGGANGCVMSLDITGGFPTVGSGSTALAAPGGTSGIIPDNNSLLPEASSVYYTTRTGATLVKATQAALQ